ncbi:MAG: agglutinin biogenesis protein [Gallionella sp.]|nr:agglutinin biogenesis protein [Gallionella sp.]
MKHYFELARIKVESLLLRERVIVFSFAASALIYLAYTMSLNPILVKQKELFAQVAQQQEKMKSLQTQIEIAIQAKKDDDKSPLRERLKELQQQLKALDEHLQSGSSRMVEPNEISKMLGQVLGKNGKLQLIALETMPSIPVVAQSKKTKTGQKQVFKHGVKITLRGSYLDLLQYLSAVEKAPVHLYWGELNFNVDRHPDAVLVLTLYTLSLDKEWLKV